LQVRYIGNPGAVRFRPKQIDVILGSHRRRSIFRPCSSTISRTCEI
jgi:hypothetical protein